ncbi:MAG TPA: hypothetical protein VIV40_08725 [Kofleriaceae bacterium]
MKLLVVALIGTAACSTQDNLGNHVFGEPRWSVALGSPGSDRATSAIVDPSGNVIVAGTCGGVIDFGSGPVDCYGAFISQRASETGREQWTARLPNARVSQLIRVGNEIHAVGTRPVLDGLVEEFIAALDTSGQLKSSMNLGLAGIVTDPVATFGADGTIFTTGRVTAGTPDAVDAFVAAHYADGTLAWTRTLAGDGIQIGTAITVAPGGDLVVVLGATGSFDVGGTLVDVDQPRQVIVRMSQAGELRWSQWAGDVVQRLALTPSDGVVVAGCPSTGMFDSDGNEQWWVTCKDPLATVDSLAVSSEGEIVIGGHHADAAGEDGELFLIAFDNDGNLISSARSVEFAEPSESRIGAIAVEPTGEVVFATTATHAFDFGNGLLPFAGEEDVIVAKLDSSTGRDGQVLLARTIP